MVNNNNEDIPRGPEDLPLRKYVTIHPIVILIIDIKSKRKIREEHINYSDSEARKWLGRLTHYATSNGYEVRTCAEADYVVEE